MAEIKTVLTNDHIIDDAWNNNMEDHHGEIPDKVIEFARAIEAAVLSALTPPTWRCCEKMVEQGAGNMVCCGEPIEVAVLSANAGKDATPTYTTGHCEHNKQPGGCQQHNLHCGWPKCDQKEINHA